MIRCNLFVWLQRWQFLAWLCLYSMAPTIALILDVTCAIRHISQHWAFSLPQLWARASPFVILIHRVELVQLVGKTHTPQRLWFILGRVVYYTNISGRGANLSLEISEYGLIVCLYATLHIVLINILYALQFILLVIGASGTTVSVIAALSDIFLDFSVISVNIIVSRTTTLSCIGI